MTMVGDSADPLIASAAAFGATAFDRQAALAAMLKGADEPCRSANGEYLERQGLAALPGARLRPLRPRHQRPQRQLDLRQSRRRLGLGGDHARVRGR